MNQHHEWKKGFWAKGDAGKIGAELEEIARQNGGKQSAGAMVKYAENPKTELHKDFEWDNEKCGIAHRLDEARCIIRNIVIVQDKQEGVEVVQVKIRKYESIGNGEYMDTVTVLGDDKLRAQLFERITDQIKAFAHKLKTYRGLMPEPIYERTQLALAGMLEDFKQPETVAAP